MELIQTGKNFKRVTFNKTSAQLLFIIYQSRKGSDCPIIANSETAAVSKSLEGLFSGLTW